MRATELLHNLGQSLWLDNITRDLLDGGTLQRYVDELSVTGLTSNPTIFDHAIKNSTAYDAAIREKLAKGKAGEALFFELALDDLTRAADMFRPIHDRTRGRVGIAEVSPLLAHDTASTWPRRRTLPERADRISSRFPAKEGLPAIESDLRGYTDQRHPVVLSRAVRGGGGVSCAVSATDRCGPQPQRRIRCPRSSSAAGMPPSPEGARAQRTSSASQSRSGPTKRPACS
jgi:hypothetical protein